MEDRFSKLESAVSSLAGEINKLNEDFKSVAENLKEHIETVQKNQEVLSSNVTLKVDAHEIINAINNSPDNVRIKGNKIHINKDALIDEGIMNK